MSTHGTKTIPSIPDSKKVNYVICSWSGERKPPTKYWEEDKSYLLRKHMYFLDTLSHNLKQITIVDQINPNGASREYIDYLNEIEDRVHIISHPNIGISYRAWWEAYLITRKQEFDYYIFIEDDYVPVIDNFDSILIDLIESNEHCGYLCGLTQEFQSWKLVPSVSNGIVKRQALDDIFESGVAVSTDGVGHVLDSKLNAVGQIIFGNAFIDNEWNICNYTDQYSTYFYRYNEKCELLGGEDSNPQIIAPIQMIHPETNILSIEETYGI